MGALGDQTQVTLLAEQMVYPLSHPCSLQLTLKSTKLEFAVVGYEREGLETQ